MLRKIRKYFKPVKRVASKLTEQKGQIAILLIIATAILFIFYAMSFNLAKVSEQKVLVTRASTAASSMFAAQIGGLAESYFRTALGNESRYCRDTSVWGAIFAFIVVIVATWYCVGTCAGLTAPMAAAIIGLAAASLVMQVVVVQPGMTAAWNKMMSKTMTREDRFMETGLQAGLTTSVSDREQVPDWIDMDMDAYAGGADNISRFSHYYTMRLIMNASDINAALLGYLNALADLLYGSQPSYSIYGDNDDWGVHDPMDCLVNEDNPCCSDRRTRPSDCNSCCLSFQVDSANDECRAAYEVTRATCAANTPYPDANLPYIYEMGLDNRYNNVGESAFFSFREKIGRDDEITRYGKVSSDINAYEQAILPGPDRVYRLEDTTGYQRNDLYENIYPYNDHPLWSGGEIDVVHGRGVFPFFYKVDEWGMNLNALDPTTQLAHCHWTDLDYLGVAGCRRVDVRGLSRELAPDPSDFASGRRYLQLTRNPGELYCQVNAFVDAVGDVGGMVPAAYVPDLGNCRAVAVDGIRDYEEVFPDSPKIVVDEDDDVCANYLVEPFQSECHSNLGGYDQPLQGFWKKGVDRFCSNDDSYHSGCFSQIDGRDCLCGECSDPRSSYLTDPLDMIAYGLDYFVSWGADQVEKETDAILGDFSAWYVEASEYVESTACYASRGDCYSNCAYEEPSYLRLLAPALQEMQDRILNWFSHNFSDTAGDDVWCVPENDPDFISNAELATMRNPPAWPPGAERGSIPNIASCLSWNAYDTYFGVGVDATGNAEKFDLCADEDLCIANIDFCSGAADQTPRCMFDQFEANFLDVDMWLNYQESEVLEYEECLAAYAAVNFPADQSPPNCCLANGEGDMTLPGLPADQISTIDACQEACRNLPTNGQRFTNEASSAFRGGDVAVELDPTRFQDAELETVTASFTCDTCLDYADTPVDVPGIPSNPDLGLPIEVMDSSGVPVIVTDADGLPVLVYPGDAMPTVVLDPDFGMPIVVAPGDPIPIDPGTGLPLVPVPVTRTEAPPGVGLPVLVRDADGAPVVVLDAAGQPVIIYPGDPMPVIVFDVAGEPIVVLGTDGQPILLSPGDPMPTVVFDIDGNPVVVLDGDPIPVDPDGIPLVPAPVIETEMPNVTDEGDLEVDCDPAVEDCGCNGFSSCITEYQIISNRSEATCNPASEAGRIYFQHVEYGLSLQKGSCSQGHSNFWGISTEYFNKLGYADAVQMCADEAVNQVDKFKLRANFLNRRIAEAKEVVDLFESAQGPLQEYAMASDILINAVEIYFGSLDEPFIERSVIYGWRDDPEEWEVDGVSEWHLVKVDGRIPKNMPYVDTYTKDWGTTRCYEIRNDEGEVTARVTRADQGKVKEVMFPGGQKIWDVRSWKGEPATNVGWSALEGCIGEGGGRSRWHPDGAFMINDSDGCAGLANNLLNQHGLSVTTCAQYTMGGDGTDARDGARLEMLGRCDW